MGDQSINYLNSEAKKDFLKHLLNDIAALERMIDEGIIEKGVHKIGAEQEFCLVKPNFRPSFQAPEILESINEKHYTAELARWNLEINLDPQNLEAGCFNKMHNQLDDLLKLGREKAKLFNDKIILTGILPTIRMSELDFSFMTPNPRYQILDNILKEFKGDDFTLYLEGVDEINIKHNSILFEACNTSYQIHLQVEAEEFANQYNWAQVVAGPIMAASVNSPILLGKELWSETRIALFRQSIDIRNAGNFISDKQPRVAFGHGWIKESAAEIFKDDISKYNLIISGEIEEDSLEILDRGGIPELKAMNLHNGTIYKWNRPCYGIGNGVPHLRIENRYIPSGPTTHDEMANVAFWTGLQNAIPEEYLDNWENKMYFQDVRSNFLKAARNGLNNEFRWFGKSTRVSEIILKELLPLAEKGLSKVGIGDDEKNKYLNTIQKRVETKQTGADWIIRTMRKLRHKHTSDESLLILTQAMYENEQAGLLGHEWKLPKDTKLVNIPDRYERVDALMRTNLFTVREDDLMIFAEKIMLWNDIIHLPVENNKGQINGIVTIYDVDKFKEQYKLSEKKGEDVLVRDFMANDIISIHPETSLEKACEVMKINGFGCLPIVKDGILVGIITDTDIRDVKSKC